MSSPPLDGRAARRLTNRQAVISAVLSFLAEDVLHPSPRQISERSGVSERSIFRYFESLDELRLSVVATAFGRVAQYLEIPKSLEASVESRISRIVSDRLTLFESIGFVARAARTRELTNPIAVELQQEFRTQMGDQVAAVFAPELAARPEDEAVALLSAMTVLLSFDAWELQTRDFCRTSAQVRRGWKCALAALLA